MRIYHCKLSALFFLSLSVISCSKLGRSTPGKLEIILQETPVTKEQNLFSSLLYTSLYSSLPTSTADFNCFAVNVTGAGIVSDQKILKECVSTDGYRGKGVGVFSQPVPRGQSIELDFTGGTNRSIDVYGIFPNLIECGGSPSGSSASQGYFLGGVSKDIFESMSISIPIVYSSGTTGTISCPGASGSQTAVFGGTGAFTWGKSFGGASAETIQKVFVDGSGQVYVTGSFTGTVDFDPGAGVTNLTAAGATDMYFSKFDSGGNLIYAKSVGIGGQSISGRAIHVDTSGNVYVAGVFAGANVDFDPGAGATLLTASGTVDIFVVKYNAALAVQWVKNIGGVGAIASPKDVSLDNSGNIYICGQFNSTIDADPGAGTVNLSSLGIMDIVVDVLDTSGTYVNSMSLGAAGNDACQSIAVDNSGSLYITGGYSNTVDFDPSGPVVNLSSAGVDDAFFAKYTTNFVYTWAYSFGGAASDKGFGVTVDGSSNPVFTAEYQGAGLDFNPALGASLSSTGSPAVTDVLIVKLTPGGGLSWAKSLGGNGAENAIDIASDAQGGVYVTGHFAGSTDLDPGAGSAVFASAGSSDIFFTKLDAGGTYSWGFSLGQAAADLAGAAFVDTSGHSYFTGTFAGTVDLDLGAGTQNATSSGSDDAFIIKLD